MRGGGGAARLRPWRDVFMKNNSGNFLFFLPEFVE